MQHFLLRTHVRGCLNRRVWKLLVASVPLHDSFIKYDHFAKLSTSCPSPSSHFGELTRLSELEVVVSKIHVGSSENEVLNSLVNDEACEGISVSHTLVDTLLCRFKDDWKSASGVFRWAESRPHFEHLPEAFDLMVDILGKARQFDKMMELVGEMCERNSVTLKTVAIMMRRFAGARQWKDAVRTFDELRTYGLDKNAESMNLLLDTLCKENQVDMARIIFSELKSHIAPTVHSYNIFIHGWCKIKRVEEAYWTLQEMKGQGFSPCVISYSTIIQSYCRLSNWDKVYELLEGMEAQGFQASIVTYTTIMSSLAKADKLEDALKIADKVKSSGCKPDTLFYNALIYTLGKAQRLREAFDVFEVEMPKSGAVPNTSTYNTLIALFCRHGQEQTAFNILEDMDKSAFCKPDLRTFSPLLKACFKLGMTDSCLSKLLDDMATKHHLSLDVSTYSLLIHGFCKLEKCDQALLLFAEMMDKELTPTYHTCRLLLSELKQKSMNDAVERVELYIEKLKASKQHKYSGSRASMVTITE